MGMYVGVRGWLELRADRRGLAEEVIRRHDDGGHYRGGWAFPAHRAGETLLLFYGGDIRDTTLPWFRAQIDELATVALEGMFVLSDECREVRTWQVRDGAVTETSAPDLVWLDD